MSGISSNLLKANINQIMTLWEERSLKEVPSAVTARRLVLRNSLPLYLNHLSEALATNRKMDSHSVFAHDQEGLRIGKMHGEDRAGRTSYVLTEVIFEYHILREIIFQVLEVDGQLPVLQRDIILDSIEQAVNDAAVKFSEVHADVQQTFINTLTHDLKNPITGAKMNAQLILKSVELSAPCGKLAQRVISGMDRLTAMIHNLLDAGKVRAGEQLSLQFGDCDLNLILAEVVADMKVMHGDRFVVNSVGAICGEWSQDGIRRALENLIDNAVKYGATDLPITVSLKHEGSSIALSVHNQGAVIPKDEIPLMFEQYRRSKSAESGSNTGWGLGLTLVKGVMDAHRGKIRIESAENQGTTFILDLPSS